MKKNKKYFIYTVVSILVIIFLVIRTHKIINMPKPIHNYHTLNENDLIPRLPTSYEFLPNDTLIVVQETHTNNVVGWVLFKTSNPSYTSVFQALVEPVHYIPAGTQIKVAEIYCKTSYADDSNRIFFIKN